MSTLNFGWFVVQDLQYLIACLVGAGVRVISEKSKLTLKSFTRKIRNWIVGLGSAYYLGPAVAVGLGVTEPEMKLGIGFAVGYLAAEVWGVLTLILTEVIPQGFSWWFRMQASTITGPLRGGREK